MKRMYDFGRAPAKRDYTVKDLKDLKGSGIVLSMSNPANEAELRACLEAEIDLLVVWAEQLGDAVFSFVADACGEASEEDRPPKHAHAWGDVGRLHKQIHEERVAAMGQFHTETRAGNFPYDSTNISMLDGEHDKFLEALDNL